MKIIALDSSGMVASVAVFEDGVLLAEYTVNYKKTHSQTLLPMLDEVVKMTELELASVDAIAVAAGPGSFTGLRIGASTAKGLGLAMGIPLIPVSTLEALAYNLYGTCCLICPIMDARRDQVYTGIYRFEGEKLKAVKEPMALGVDDLARSLNEMDQEVIFLGDGVPVYQDKLKTLIRVSCAFAPGHLSRQRAGAVAALGWRYYQEGKVQTAAEHVPEYLRMSQAERERKKRLEEE